MHADFIGESNFEAITWLPLVNVNKTKSLYVFPLKRTEEIEKNSINLILREQIQFLKNIKEI